MSAVALAIGDDAIVVAADGVSYDLDDGQILGFASKVIPMPERNAVIAWTGMGMIGQALVWEFGQDVTDFDSLVENLPEAAKAAHMKLCIGMGRRNFDADENKISILLAGYSVSRGKFEGYRLVNYSKVTRDHEGNETGKLVPWTMNPISYVWASHSPPAEVAKRFGLIDAGDLTELCARYVCANRALSGPVLDEDGDIDCYYGVGGFLQMVVLKRDHVQSWIAHRWPDEIGERVNPDAGEPMPVFPLKLPN